MQLADYMEVNGESGSLKACKWKKQVLYLGFNQIT